MRIYPICTLSRASNAPPFQSISSVSTLSGPSPPPHPYPAFPESGDTMRAAGLHAIAIVLKTEAVPSVRVKAAVRRTGRTATRRVAANMVKIDELACLIGDWCY